MKRMKKTILLNVIAVGFLSCSQKPKGISASDIEKLYPVQITQLESYATNFTAYWNGTLRWQTPEDKALFAMPEILDAEVQSFTSQGGARWGTGGTKSRTFYFSSTPAVGHSTVKTGSGVLSDGSKVEVLEYEARVKELATGKERGFLIVFDLEKLKQKSEQPAAQVQSEGAPSD